MHSILFTIFGLPIRAYGLMMVIGFSLGLWRAVLVAKKRDLNIDRIYDLALVVLLSGVIGSRVVYVLLNPQTESFSRFFAVWEGGLSFHGGVIFAVLAAYIYTKRTTLSFLQCADLLAPSVAIGYAFTRIGCFLNGCCYGCPTSLPWGVRFIESGALTPPSHPTQIYATIANLLIFALLTRLEKLKRANGFIFVSYLGLYGVYRFLVEFLRKGYSAQVWALGFTQAQWVSIVMILASLAIVFAKYRRPSSK